MFWRRGRARPLSLDDPLRESVRPSPQGKHPGTSPSGVRGGLPQKLPTGSCKATETVCLLSCLAVTHPPTGTMATSKQSLPCAVSDSCRLGTAGRRAGGHPMLPQTFCLASLLPWPALCTFSRARGSRPSCYPGSSSPLAQRTLGSE